MTPHIILPPPDERTAEPKRERRDAPEPRTAGKRRPAWRQRLIDVERGMTLGFRGDSSFFVHFFITTVVILTAFVLGLSLMQWVALILALTMVLTAEMFQQVLKTILGSLGHHLSHTARRAENIGTAAVFVTFLGAVVTIGLLFTQRLTELFGQ